jgi:hypothetical protein
LKMVSHRFVPSTMPHLCALVFGLLFLAEAEKYVAAIGASSSLDPEMSVTNHIRGEHNERMLGSENTGPGEFSFFTQWGGCGATLIWEDLLLTSASVSIRRIFNPQSSPPNLIFHRIFLTPVYLSMYFVLVLL